MRARRCDGVLCQYGGVASELSDGLTGQDLLKQVRRVVIDAYDHQELPFEEVIEALSLRREGSLSPLFNVMMVL